MARTYIRKAKATPSLVAAPVRGAGRAAKRRQLAAALTTVEHVMRRHFPEALHALKAALAVIAVGCLEDNTQPTAMVFIAHSGAGKTLVVMLVTPESDDTLLRSLFYRSDKFTGFAPQPNVAGGLLLYQETSYWSYRCIRPVGTSPSLTDHNIGCQHITGLTAAPAAPSSGDGGSSTSGILIGVLAGAVVLLGGGWLISSRRRKAATTDDRE